MNIGGWKCTDRPPSGEVFGSGETRGRGQQLLLSSPHAFISNKVIELFLHISAEHQNTLVEATVVRGKIKGQKRDNKRP